MTLYQLCEDKLSKPLPVVPSPKISQQIKAIDEYNQDNQEALTKWHHYLDGIEKYISNRSIALDYANRIRTFRNGTKFIGDFNYDVGYTVKWNSYEAYVYVFMINLNPQEFGLKIPPTLKENKSIYTNTTMNTQNKQTTKLTETQLRRMISESVKRVLYESQNGYIQDLRKEIAFNGDTEQWTPMQNKLMGSLHKFVNLSQKYKTLIPRLAHSILNQESCEFLIDVIESAIEDVKFDNDKYPRDEYLDQVYDVYGKGGLS